MKEMQHREEIYIIGAGISGLIAAYELESKGFRPIIIEQTSGVGGRVKTLPKNGYDLDLGFQVLLSAYPLANKYLNMEKLQLDKLSSGALVYANGSTYKIGDPLRDWKMLFPTLRAAVGSIGDKLKIFQLNQKLKYKSLEDIFKSPEKSTLEYLVAFGFSSRIIDRFFKPFFAGIFLEPDLKTSSRMFEFVYKMFGEGYATIPSRGIGAISEQLKSKLKYTEFSFNSEVEAVTKDHIALCSGEKITHNGVIVTSNIASLIPSFKKPKMTWKRCECYYFEVDQTNIPNKTIALMAETGKYTNNLYAYKDANSGKNILSVTTLVKHKIPEKEMIGAITAEIKQYTGATEVHYIHHYNIEQALPDIQNLKLTIPHHETEVLENVFIAGDYLLNASLNAAMESGRLAAHAIIEKNKETHL